MRQVLTHIHSRSRRTCHAFNCRRFAAEHKEDIRKITLYKYFDRRFQRQFFILFSSNFIFKAPTKTHTHTHLLYVLVYVCVLRIEIFALTPRQKTERDSNSNNRKKKPHNALNNCAPESDNDESTTTLQNRLRTSATPHTYNAPFRPEPPRLGCCLLAARGVSTIA